ncbi:hypothetical protein L6R44_10625 [Enterobacter cloacae complex sp. ECC445]|uniref:hypothetical protein n=1 Tax=Enterobacter cloacae complex sp. ECC445 TaxID=2913213 RepID=UPI001F1D5BCD|nr:hypothetical protein [Enterobacter cloacae complex sp. ECC445]MCG0456559.1 hypothetical protein [Enterobacter cloacae complex sp. ECC445]
MPKFLTPSDFAEIVSGLLVDPQRLGAFAEPGDHQAFLAEMGHVVARHCGGKIDGVMMPEGGEEEQSQPYLSCPETTPYLVVSPDASLPSLTHNVWRYMCANGWVDAVRGTPDTSTDALPTRAECREVRTGLQRLLIPVDTAQCNLKQHIVRMQDNEHDGGDTLPEEKIFKVSAALGGVAQIAVQNHQGRTVFGAVLTIENDTPSLHINPGDTELASLHIHAAHEGLVLATGSADTSFTLAPVDCFTYGRSGLLVRTGESLTHNVN